MSNKDREDIWPIVYQVLVIFGFVMVFFAVTKNTQVSQELNNKLDPIETIDTVFVDRPVHDTVKIYLPQQAYLKHLLDSLDVKHADVVLAQAMLESGWMECEDCSLDHNNPYGFQYKGEYLEFESLIEATVYMKWWQDKHYSSQDGYFEFLEARGYATSPTYEKKVKTLLNQI